MIYLFFVILDVYRDKLPFHCLPTYKGSFVKYSYTLTVGTQCPDSHVSEIKIPFRVLTVEGKQFYVY